MTSYARDTSAVAVYLYEETKVYYDALGIGGLKTNRHYAVKIKILKSEGVSLADVEIPYSSEYERISSLEVSSYNRVDGKIVETKMKNKDVVTEKVTEDVLLRKFSIPNVREGSVIEYKYTVASSFPVIIHPIRVQHEYPVVYSFSEVAIPDILQFNVNTQGAYTLAGERSTSSALGLQNNVYTFIGEDIPALKPEPFVWCMDDFETKVSFELRSADIPGVPIYNFTNTWEKVDETLNGAGFDDHLRMRNPLRTEVDRLTAEYPDERDSNPQYPPCSNEAVVNRLWP